MQKKETIFTFWDKYSGQSQSALFFAFTIHLNLEAPLLWLYVLPHHSHDLWPLTYTKEEATVMTPWHQHLHAGQTNTSYFSLLALLPPLVYVPGIQEAFSGCGWEECVRVCLCCSEEVRVYLCVGLCWGPAGEDILLCGG